MPAKEPTFRNLYLNQRVAPVSSMISRAEWMACVGDAEIKRGERVFAALDLSAVLDLTSLMLASDTERTRILPFAWKPSELLEEHSDRDFGNKSSRYTKWAEEGHLLTSPGKSIDPGVVAKKIAELYGQFIILGLAYDRWRISDLLREFDRIGFAAWIDKGENTRPGRGLRLCPWGQGYKDMAPAVDALELEVAERRLVHPSNPVLNWSMGNAVVHTDPAGNRKIMKDKTRFRIDPAVALTMVVGLRSRERDKVPLAPLIG
jgi:phage terminase large subunit-like protein